MRPTNRFRSLHRLPGALALAASLAVPLAARASQPQDAWITTRLKAQVLTAPSVAGGDIHVDTSDGRVTLHGVVADDAAKTRVGAWAEQIDGVRSVRNVLAVVPEARRDEVAERDRALERRVQRALASAPDLAEGSVEVASVHDGIVVLRGDVRSLDAHRRALAAARGVPGVRQVASEIHSPDPGGDALLWWETGASTDAAGADLGRAARDAWITAKAKLRLMTGPTDLAPGDASVETEDGVVTIFGVVATADQRVQAEQELLSLDGVRRVENQLAVVPDAEREGSIPDDVVRRLVQARLQERGGLGEAAIEVEAERGVVRLRGSVPSWGDRLHAVTVARSTSGVRSVVDDLEVAPRT